MQQLESGKPLTRIEHHLLSTCWEYLSPQSTIQHKPPSEMTSVDLVHYISDALLIQLVHALDEPPLAVPHVLSYILRRYQTLLNVPNLPSCDQHANYIINYLSNVLQASSSANQNYQANTSIVLNSFRELVNISRIRSLVKKSRLTSLFNKYTSSETPEQIRQLAFAILAHTIDEQDINKDPTNITAAFLDQLTHLHPHIHNPHLDVTLASLKGIIFILFHSFFLGRFYIPVVVLMQHEQIKNEFVSQGGLTKLVQFVRDGDPKKQSAQQLEDVLKIIWSCTFNNPQAVEILREDTKFIERVNEVMENAKQDGNSRLEKAGEGVVWKVVKEEKFEQEQQERKEKALKSGTEEIEGEEEQYDCMISYSWSDTDLVDRIFRHLTDKLGYKVWLDREQMHGSTIEAMVFAFR